MPRTGLPRPSQRLDPARAFVAAASLGLTLAAAPPARACGFENPQRVSLGMLNWTYPDALHVRTAVWQAENAGVLPPRGGKPATGSLAFYRAAASMSKLGALASAARRPNEARSFAIVLVPEVMWTRFVPNETGFAVRPHATGPEAGETVIVTGDKVVRALVAGAIGVEVAEAYGLLRFYGAGEGREAVRAMLAQAMRRPAAASGTADARPTTITR